MTELLRQFEEAGGTLALFSRVEGGSVGTPPHRLAVRDVHSGERVELTAAAVVNSAGMHAQVGMGRLEAGGCRRAGVAALRLTPLRCAAPQAVAASLRGMPPQAVPPLHLAKGSYFSLAPGALASMAPAAAGGGAGPRPRGFRHLIYPLPEPGTAGLGTHLTLDLAGGVRFGPDVEWWGGPAGAARPACAHSDALRPPPSWTLQWRAGQATRGAPPTALAPSRRLPAGTRPAALDYGVSAARAQPFYAAIRAYLPALPDGALVPAYSGVRPKVCAWGGGGQWRRRPPNLGVLRLPGALPTQLVRLRLDGPAMPQAHLHTSGCPPRSAAPLRANAQVVGPGQPAGDFVLQGPRQHGVPGLLNLFGIESPGLTASLAIARRVTSMLLGRVPGVRAAS
jgi:hypothetical protein